MKFANISKGLLLGLALLLATSAFAAVNKGFDATHGFGNREREATARRRLLGEVGWQRSQC